MATLAKYHMPNLTLVDKFVSYFSPERGARRQAWRAYAAYQGGIATRLDKPWPRDISYATGTQGSRLELGFARDRARAMDRENPVARGILNREVDNVVGEGMTLQARTVADDFNDESEERFSEWLETAEITGIQGAGGFQRMAYRTARRDGDAAVLLVDQGGRSKLQIIPGDLIRTPDGMVNRPSGNGTAGLADGVEVGSFGQPTGFNIGDFDEWGKRKFTRVDANQVCFLSHTTEPLQLRGETCFMHTFNLLNNLDRYVDGVGLAAWMATVFGIIFKDGNGAKSLGGLPSVLNSQGNNQRAITLENGAVKYIGQADDVVQVDAKQPMQQTPDFIRMMLRLIGLSLDMPLELVLLDVSQANLSSLRGGMQQYYRSSKNRQQVFGKRVLGKIYRWWVSREVREGNFTSAVPDHFWPHVFQPRGWAFTDPVKEIQAAMLECEAGINSPQNVCATLGRDWDHVQEQRKAAQDIRQAFELPDIRSIMTRDPLAPPPDEPIDPTADEDAAEPDPELEDDHV